MDLTIRQLRERDCNELQAFKKEIISYLDNKRHITKSVTLLKTLHLINKVLKTKEGGKSLRLEKLSKKHEDKDEFLAMNLSFNEFPMFLQDSSSHTIKRKKMETEDMFLDRDFIDSGSFLGVKKSISEDFGNELDEYSRDLYGSNCYLIEYYSNSAFDTQSSNDLHLEEDDNNSYISFC